MYVRVCMYIQVLLFEHTHSQNRTCVFYTRMHTDVNICIYICVCVW